MQVISSNGRLELCMFRIKREFEQGDNNVFHENFMPCVKEDCACYERKEFGKTLYECCHRENINFLRNSNIETGGFKQ